jgi:enamine deaminase RidA (YjgF/YER057c/UK114 family)
MSSIGAAATLLGLTHSSSASTPVAQGASSPEQRLRELGLELPPAPTPVATYVPTVRVGDTLYVSGTGPNRPDGSFIQGKVGGDMSIEEANEAARVVGLNVLSAIRDALGSLDRVVRVAKVHGMVNAVPEFTQQPQVVNGFSDLMVEVFGEEAGKGARSAVGMGSLPFNIPVEIESVFVVRD